MVRIVFELRKLVEKIAKGPKNEALRDGQSWLAHTHRGWWLLQATGEQIITQLTCSRCLDLVADGYEAVLQYSGDRGAPVALKPCHQPRAPHRYLCRAIPAHFFARSGCR